MGADASAATVTMSVAATVESEVAGTCELADSEWLHLPEAQSVLQPVTEAQSVLQPVTEAQSVLQPATEALACINGEVVTPVPICGVMDAANNCESNDLSIGVSVCQDMP